MTSNYWASTQCNDWLLSRPQIAIARAEDLEYATSANELFSIRIWLTNCISSLTKRLALRQRITATAIVFFNRFYACSPGNSLSSTDPTLVATACVYVASKVEESPVHIRNVVQEAIKLWAEFGHYRFPNDVASLAEMEFYLLEDLQFHLVVYHPYRSLITIAGAVGKGNTNQASTKAAIAVSWNKMMTLPVQSAVSPASILAKEEHHAASPLSGVLEAESLSNIFDSDLAFGSPGDGLSGKSEDAQSALTRSIDREKAREQEQRRALEEMIEERHRMLLYGGDDDMPLAQLEELDEQVLQMAWFVLNDTYRTDLLLVFPPHLIAIAAIFLALVLHDSSREKMLKSKKWMQDRREKYGNALQTVRSEGTNGNNVTSSHVDNGGKEAEMSSPVVAASPPKQQHTPQPSIPVRPPQPLRGLASLPPRPSHLPPRPQQSPAQASNPATPVGTPKVSDMTSPAAETSTPKTASVNTTLDERSKARTPSLQLPAPPPDAMTFLAALNVDLNDVGEIVQEMIGLYQFWSREGRGEDGQGQEAIDLNDGPSMFKRLERMRELRRNDLLQNGPGW